VDLLTPREAARRLGVSYPTIKQWIYKGTVRTRPTPGGHHRIPDSEIERLLAATGRPLPKLGRTPTGVVLALSGRNSSAGSSKKSDRIVCWRRFGCASAINHSPP
jgi:excisionase family DNA binding protein